MSPCMQGQTNGTGGDSTSLTTFWCYLITSNLQPNQVNVGGFESQFKKKFYKKSFYIIDFYRGDINIVCQRLQLFANGRW